MSIGDGCFHGKTWKQRCYKCELISTKGSLEWVAPLHRKLTKRLKFLKRKVKP